MNTASDCLKICQIIGKKTLVPPPLNTICRYDFILKIQNLTKMICTARLYIKTKFDKMSSPQEVDFLLK